MDLTITNKIKEVKIICIILNHIRKNSEIVSTDIQLNVEDIKTHETEVFEYPSVDIEIAHTLMEYYLSQGTITLLNSKTIKFN